MKKGDNGITVYNPMNKNTSKAPNSKKRKISTTDIILICLGIFVLVRTPWSNMNSFYYLIFFLYIFCIMMRITNMRKLNAKKAEMQQKEAEAEILALEEKSNAELSAAEDANEAEQASAVQENDDTEKDTQS
ncbi:MAG: hypothetical protein EOM28_08740 [Clostridia bacterium]|nr:hypothetical protein [Clostridia bacterium]